MVLVQGGTFTMGDTKGERPGRKVTVATFSIAKTETTIGQYKAYLKAIGSKVPERFSGIDDRYPVFELGFSDIRAYYDWLSDRTGRRYRLPTESEWEYAARGGKLSKGFKYSGSNDIDEVAWHYDNSSGSLQMVARGKPNELGLYDMSGNVKEMCSYARPNDPKGGYDYRNPIFRGGSWSSDQNACAVSPRVTLMDDIDMSLLDDLLGGLDGNSKTVAKDSVDYSLLDELLGGLDDKSNTLVKKVRGSEGFRLIMVK